MIRSGLMVKGSFEEGTSSMDDFVRFINERHKVWERRNSGEPWPWTEDEVLQKWKFTNVYRELDTGTIALRRLLDGVENAEMIVWTTIWYRLFNWQAHADHFEEPPQPAELYRYLRSAHKTGMKIFTSAHMTTGVLFEDKVETYIRASQEAYESRSKVLEVVRRTRSMEATFKELLGLYMVGGFVAYEIACDFRFNLCEFTDRNDWCNIGPGAKRGLRRLGLPVTLDGIKSIQVPNPGEFLWELREIEHSLCEFDKYERTRTGQGRPRQKYRRPSNAN
jgi:hypothetical protein